MPQPSVITRNLTKSFNGAPVLESLSLDLTGPAMVGVAGPSGRGKSTLLNCLGGLDPVDSGEVVVNGKDIVGASRAALARIYRNDLGFLFQDYGLVQNQTVEQNLQLAQKFEKASSRNKAERLKAALDSVGLLGREKSKCYTLSGGQQQRVAVARLLVKQPSVILADEPTASLDSANEDLVLEKLLDLARTKSLVIVASHSDKVLSTCGFVFEL